MDEERKGEIALALLKQRLYSEGIHFNPNINREIGNVAEATGIAAKEIREFLRVLFLEMLEEALGEQG